ncbi:endocuticle structural glycoprotein SgAbd-2-like [Zerene cesonia]|uniref:endocuticle structural glycoprotein SgAbd-2-like n=1 Tax=Zerene cesonia TaxID=33412 RepID=UPI0018E5588A|nr:endocuticle structural glycoprotein SgAbd-2-like [Zerene cesonia]
MKHYIILALASIAAAAKLEKVYLPPDVASASGADAGLQTPFEPSESQSFGGQRQGFGGQRFTNQDQLSLNYNRQSERYANQAEILRFENEINQDGFRYAYETSDGTKAEQEGRVIPGSLPEQGSLLVTGSYSYVGDDGKTYTVTYVADENGFQATGDHLPTPPPVPEAILKSLQLINSNGIYSSQKSSYDADAGL